VSAEVRDVRSGLERHIEVVQQRVRDETWHLLDGTLDAQLRLDLPRDDAAELLEHFGAGLVAHALVCPSGQRQERSRYAVMSAAAAYASDTARE
jgi:hypothetical protein